MTHCFTTDTEGLTIVRLTKGEFSDWLAQQDTFAQTWLRHNAFEAKAGNFCLIPNQKGGIDKVVLGVERHNDMWNLSALAKKLPAGNYQGTDISDLQALGWGLGSYRYSRYQTSNPLREQAKLQFANPQVEQQLRALYLIRDLINTPASDMMPQHLAQATQELAAQFGATFEEVVGDDLLARNYPAIHAVGRASTHAPRLLDLRWGDVTHKKVTLVGKGVCFDSGGLDIKPAKGMRWMKKDMGGGAHVLGLASMIMAGQLPVRLRVLIPAVENAVSANAFRPGDVLSTRSGKTVEIDNTDAEGRLVLCDALCEAASETPELIIDFATLTGAARIALGTELPAFFGNNDTIAAELIRAAEAVQDPIWRLPLHKPYRDHLNSNIADIANSSDNSYGGAISAALYLEEFIKGCPWLHFDIMAFNTRERPGRPYGGEAMGVRAVYRLLETM